LNELACACIVTPDDPALRTHWRNGRTIIARAHPVAEQYKSMRAGPQFRGWR